MSEPVPLCSTLSVQFVPFIVADVLGDDLDLVFETFSVESWNFWMVQRETTVLLFNACSTITVADLLQ